MNNNFDVTCDGGDIHCPLCKKSLGITNWRTEYGDAIAGEYNIQCPYCEHDFRIDVEPIVHYTVLS